MHERRARLRTAFAVAAAAAACLALTLRLGWLMMARGGRLSERSFDQRMRTIPVLAPRGAILDRAGRVLAGSITAYAAYAVPAEVEGAARTAARLAAVLERPADGLSRRLSRRVALVWLARRLTAAQAAAVRRLALPGVGLVPEARRVYPYGPLAAEVVGFVGSEGQGLAGLELSYDRYLRGRDGAIRVEYDARNRRLPRARTSVEEPRPGDTLVTTLDVGVQEMAQEELDRAVAETGARAGLVLVMDVRTGGILALAASPTFDPGAYDRYAPSRWRDPAVSDTYPPGSTFKPITVASALDAGVVTPDSGFFDPGFLRVDGRDIRCWRAGGHGPETLRVVLRNSCNVALGEIGLRLGTGRFYRYLARFGLTSRTGVDLPGEARAIVPREADVKPVDLAVMSFGQTLTVTALELASAIAAIANGGHLVRPHVGAELLSPEGRPLRRLAFPPRGEPVRPAVAAAVASMMEDVVLNGSGKRAQVPGYRLAGKTGTSQVVVGGRYEPGQYIASFVGFGPVPRPQVLCLVVIDRPQGAHYGGEVAAPVFARVMARALPYLGIPPAASARAGKLPPVVPQVAGESPVRAAARLRAAGLTPRRAGKAGAVVVGTWPPAGETAPGGRVLVFDGPGPPHRSRTRSVS